MTADEWAIVAVVLGSPLVEKGRPLVECFRDLIATVQNDERQACAEIADSIPHDGGCFHADQIAAAIRKRGDA